MTELEGEDAGLDRATIVALVAMALGIFVVANDFTALSVAVADIEESLDADLNRAQWVINAYTVVFGVLIVTGGRLADLFGRRRSFIIGAAVFATFSLLGGVAPTIELLIAARALMGVGGALMWPAVLGMTYALLPEEKAGLAGGLVIGVAGLGNALGPLIAGALTDAASWRWVFFVNVPVALVAILVTRRNVAESRVGEAPGIDYRGIAMLSVSVILVLVALDVGVQTGFGDPPIVGMLLAGVLLLVAFAFVEGRSGPAALVPRRVTSSRQFVSATIAVVLVSSTFFGVLLFVPQFTQKDLGWSALEAGAGLLPVMLVFGATSFAAGPLYNRVGARTIVTVGAGCMAVGVSWTALTIGGDYPVLVPGLLVVGVGVGLFYSGATTAAVTVVDPDDGSLAGGIVYMGNVAGGAIGLGLNTAIVLSASSMDDGIRTAFLVDGALAFVAAVVVFAFVRSTVPGEASVAT